MQHFVTVARHRVVAETALLAIGAAQGLFLTLGLLAKRSANRGVRWSLICLVGALTILALGQLTRFAWPSVDLRWVGYLSINTELALGPLLLLFARYVVAPERRWRARDSWTFAPLAVGVSLWAGLYVVPWVRGAELSPALFKRVALGFFFVKASLFYAFLFATFETLRRGAEGARRLAVSRRSRSLEWLTKWVVALAVAVTALYLLVFVDALAPGVRIDTDLFSNLTLVALLYLVSAMALLRPWVLSARPRPPRDERLAADVRRLEVWFEGERPYLEPELTLRDLATALRVTENRLSMVLNDGLGVGFYELLNRHRLAHFERLAGDRDLRGRTVLDLAFESGFASKASFYRAFRDAHGTTPTAFRRLQLS